MTDIRTFINQARDHDVIDAMARDRLLTFEREFSQTGAATGSGLFSELGEPVDKDDRYIPEVSEAPRLIRGFHDVLITIGIVVSLGGFWAIGSVFLALPAVFVLAEIFVYRQKLALPGFCLTLALAQTVAAIPILGNNSGETLPHFITVFVLELAAMSGFYIRYRVPVALASAIASALLLCFLLILLVIQTFTGAATLEQMNANVVGIIGLVLAGILFYIAMDFDLADTKRVTRRSDVAFWLHLITAPLLLYSLFMAIFGDNGFWWSNNPTSSDALIAVIVITVMIVVGIIIDRRAFVTSGLISLGVALYILTKDAGITVSNVTSFSFLAVGIIVLLLGSGWQWLREKVVNKLPSGWQSKLPPVA